MGLEFNHQNLSCVEVIGNLYFNPYIIIMNEVHGGYVFASVCVCLPACNQNNSLRYEWILVKHTVSHQNIFKKNSIPYLPRL